MRIMVMLLLAMATTITGAYLVAGTAIQASSPPEIMRGTPDLTSVGATGIRTSPTHSTSGYAETTAGAPHPTTVTSELIPPP